MCGWLRHCPGGVVGVTARRCDARVYTDRRKRPLDAVLGHLCTLLRRELYDANYVGWYEHLNHHGVPVAPPSLVASLLVGKTGSARVAPPLGWHLRQGSNPHKSPMSLGVQGYTKDERAVHRAKARHLGFAHPMAPSPCSHSKWGVIGPIVGLNPGDGLRGRADSR